MIAKEAGAPYRPGERVGMVKVKRVRTIDAVVMGWRPGKAEGTLGALILGLYGEDGRLREVGHSSGFTAREKRELVAKLAPYETGERGTGEPSRWSAGPQPRVGRPAARARRRGDLRPRLRRPNPPRDQGAALARRQAACGLHPGPARQLALGLLCRSPGSRNACSSRPTRSRGPSAPPRSPPRSGAGWRRGGCPPPDLCPVADGGEGTLEVLLTALGGETAAARALDPLGRPLTRGLRAAGGRRRRGRRGRRRERAGAPRPGRARRRGGVERRHRDAHRGGGRCGRGGRPRRRGRLGDDRRRRGGDRGDARGGRPARRAARRAERRPHDLRARRRGLRPAEGRRRRRPWRGCARGSTRSPRRSPATRAGWPWAARRAGSRAGCGPPSAPCSSPGRPSSWASSASTRACAPRARWSSARGGSTTSTLEGKVAGEIATRARQAGVPCFAVVGTRRARPVRRAHPRPPARPGGHDARRGPGGRRRARPRAAPARGLGRGPGDSARRVHAGRHRVVALGPDGARERAARVLAAPRAGERAGEVVARRPAQVAPGARVVVDALDRRRQAPAARGAYTSSTSPTSRRTTAGAFMRGCSASARANGVVAVTT